MQLPACFAQLVLVEIGDVRTCKMLNGFVHGKPFPRSLEINHMLTHFHLRGTMQINGHLLNHCFNQVHHPLIILVGHIQFHLREFRIMKTGHALVAEIFTEFVNAVESAHN